MEGFSPEAAELVNRQREEIEDYQNKVAEQANLDEIATVPHSFGEICNKKRLHSSLGYVGTSKCHPV